MCSSFNTLLCAEVLKISFQRAEILKSVASQLLVYQLLLTPIFSQSLQHLSIMNCVCDREAETESVQESVTAHCDTAGV